MSASVTENAERNRYELHEDGQLAGFLDYRASDAGRDFTHTEVDKEFGGRGLGTALVQAALDDARAKQLAVVPTCSLVKRFVGKHPDYLDVIEPGSRAALESGESA